MSISEAPGTGILTDDISLEHSADGFERAITRLTLLEYRLFSVLLDRFELTPAQYHAIVFMGRRSAPCSMGCLAEHLHQSSATATGMVDRLVKRGLAERRADPLDRRRVIVRLTDSGHQLLAAAGAARRQRTITILSSFSAADRGHMVDVLEAYLDRVAAMLGDSSR